MAWAMDRPRPRPGSSLDCPGDRRQPLERLEQPVDLGRRDFRPAVGDRERRTARRRDRLHGDPATGHVVADGVVDQIRDEALAQAHVARGGRRVESSRRSAGRVGRASGRRASRTSRATAARSNGSRWSRPRWLRESVSSASISRSCCSPAAEHAPAGLAQVVDGRVGVGERDLDQRALERERGAQLVRGVRDELALRVEGGFEPLEQSVEGVAELLELVVGTVEGEAPVQVARRDLARGVGDRAQRAQRAAGDRASRARSRASAMIASASADWTSSWCSAAARRAGAPAASALCGLGAPLGRGRATRTSGSPAGDAFRRRSTLRRARRRLRRRSCPCTGARRARR